MEENTNYEVTETTTEENGCEDCSESGVSSSVILAVGAILGAAVWAGGEKAFSWGKKKLAERKAKKEAAESEEETVVAEDGTEVVTDSKKKK